MKKEMLLMLLGFLSLPLGMYAMDPERAQYNKYLEYRMDDPKALEEAVIRFQFKSAWKKKLAEYKAMSQIEREKKIEKAKEKIEHEKAELEKHKEAPSIYATLGEAEAKEIERLKKEEEELRQLFGEKYLKEFRESLGE